MIKDPFIHSTTCAICGFARADGLDCACIFATAAVRAALATALAARDHAVTALARRDLDLAQAMAEAARHEAAGKAMAAKLAEIRKDATEAKRKLDKIRSEDIGRETHSWLKASSAVGNILAAVGEPPIDRPTAAGATTDVLTLLEAENADLKASCEIWRETATSLSHDAQRALRDLQFTRNRLADIEPVLHKAAQWRLYPSAPGAIAELEHAIDAATSKESK